MVSTSTVSIGALLLLSLDCFEADPFFPRVGVLTLRVGVLTLRVGSAGIGSTLGFDSLL